MDYFSRKVTWLKLTLVCLLHHVNDDGSWIQRFWKECFQCSKNKLWYHIDLSKTFCFWNIHLSSSKSLLKFWHFVSRLTPTHCSVLWQKVITDSVKRQFVGRWTFPMDNTFVMRLAHNKTGINFLTFRLLFTYSFPHDAVKDVNQLFSKSLVFM